MIELKMTVCLIEFCLARAYMSLFDRYDQNEAESFFRDTYLLPTPQRRFEDLFEQISQHFQQLEIFPSTDESTDSVRKEKGKLFKMKDSFDVILVESFN